MLGTNYRWKGSPQMLDRKGACLQETSIHDPNPKDGGPEHNPPPGPAVTGLSQGWPSVIVCSLTLLPGTGGSKPVSGASENPQATRP